MSKVVNKFKNKFLTGIYTLLIAAFFAFITIFSFNSAEAIGSISMGATCNGTQYSAIKLAIDACTTKGSTVKLTSSSTTTGSFAITNYPGLTIDLNGQTWTTTANPALSLDNSNVIIKDSSSLSTGKMTSTTSNTSHLFEVLNGSVLTINSGIYTVKTSVFFIDSATVYLNGGSIVTSGSSEAAFMYMDTTIGTTGKAYIQGATLIHNASTGTLFSGGNVGQIYYNDGDIYSKANYKTAISQLNIEEDNCIAEVNVLSGQSVTADSSYSSMYKHYLTKTDAPAKCGSTKYTSLEIAISACSSTGSRVTLLMDTSTSSVITLTNHGGLTIDLNGYTWETTASRALTLSNSKLIISDTSATSKGKITGTGSSESFLFEVISGSILNVYKGTCIAKNTAFYVDSASVYLTGGTIVSKGTGEAALMYMDTLNGTTGKVYIQGSNLISGGSGATLFSGSNVSGIYYEGGYIYAKGNYKSAITQLTLPSSNDYISDISVTSGQIITAGGTTYTSMYKHEITKTYYVSQIVQTGNAYTTVADAFNNVSSGQTIQILRNAVEQASISLQSKTVILDLNGNEWWANSSTALGGNCTSITIGSSASLNIQGNGIIYGVEITVNSGGTLTIDEDVTLTNMTMPVIQVMGGSTYINSGILYSRSAPTVYLDSSNSSSALQIGISNGEPNDVRIIGYSEGPLMTSGTCSSATPVTYYAGKLYGTNASNPISSYSSCINKPDNLYYVNESNFSFSNELPSELQSNITSSGNSFNVVYVEGYAVSILNSSGNPSTYYNTIASAVSAASSGQTIRLEKNVTECVTIYITGSIGINLNGKTWTCSRTPLTVNGGSVSILGTGTITHDGSGSYSSIYNSANSTITIYGGTIYGIDNYNTLYIYSGAVIKKGYQYDDAISNSGGIYVNGGTIDSIFNEETLYVYDCTSIGEIYNDTSGVLSISGGNMSYVYNDGTMTMSGGNITNSGTTNGGLAIANCGTITISGSSSSSPYIKSTTGTAISNEGTLVIESGTVESTASTAGIAIENYGYLTIGKNDSSVSTTNPFIKSTKSAAIQNNGSSFAFYDGVISYHSATSGITGDTNMTTPTGYIITTAQSGTNTLIKYLVSAMVRVDSTYYSSISAALVSSNSGKTITVLKSFSEAGFTVSTSMSLNLAGYTVTISSGSITVNSGVTFTIYGGTLSGTTSSFTITNNGTLKVTSGTIKSTTGVTITNSGTATITGGTIQTTSSTSSYAINNTGTLTLGTKDTNVSTSSPVIKSLGNYGIRTTGTFNYYDGVVYSHSSYFGVISGTVSATETNYSVIKVYDSSMYKAYLYKNADKLVMLADASSRIVGYYSSISSAYSAASDGYTITLMDDVYEQVIIDDNFDGDLETLTIDLSGNTWSSDSTTLTINFAGAGCIQIKDSTGGGDITNDFEADSGMPAISVLDGCLEILSGGFHSQGNNYSTVAIYIDVDGVVNIRGGTIGSNDRVNGGYSIVNYGLLTLGIDDGSVSTTTPIISYSDGNINNSGTLAFYDGVVYGDALSGTIVTPSGYNVVRVFDGDYKSQLMYGTPVVSIIDGNDRPTSYYTSIANAVRDAANSESTIRLETNVTESVTIDSDLTDGVFDYFTIDLNGKTWSSSGIPLEISFNGLGYLQIKDSGSGGKITGGSSGFPTVLILDGHLHLLSGTIDAYSADGSASAIGIDYQGEATILGGEVTCLGMEETSIVIENYGNLTINNGMISGAPILNVGTMNITGGTIGVDIDNGNQNYEGTLTISGGNLTSITNNSGAILNITGGTVQSTSSYAITNSGILNLGTNDGSVSTTTTPVIKSTSTYGINNSGTLNFYDGVVYGSISNASATYNTSSATVNTPTGYHCLSTYDSTVQLRKDYLGEAVVKVDNVYYPSINAALISNNNGKTIIVLKDFTETRSITIGSTFTSISISLARYTVTVSDISISSGARLNIYGTGTITNGNRMDSLITVYNNATLYMLQTTLKSGGNGIYNYGTIDSMAASTIKSTNSDYTAIYNAKLSAGGSVKMDGTIEAAGRAIYNTSNCSITVSGNVSGTVINHGTMTISSGTINNEITNYSGATMTITGGTISNTITNNSGATMTITGGTVTSSSADAIDNSGTLTVTGGTVSATSTSTSTYAIVNADTLTLGTNDNSVSTTTPVIKSTSIYGIFNNSTLNFYDGVVYGSASNVSAIYNTSSATVNTPSGYRCISTYDSTEQLKKDYLGAAVVQVGDVYYSSINAALVSGNNGKTITVLKDFTEESAITIDSTFTSLSIALSGYTVTIPNGISISSSAKLNIYGSGTITNGSATTTLISVSANATLYMLQVTLVSGGNGIYNYGTIDSMSASTIVTTNTGSTALYNSRAQSCGTANMTGSINAAGKAIYNTSNCEVTVSGDVSGSIENSGTLTISSGTISKTITNNSGATLTITGGTIKNDTSSTYAINNSGTANINGGTIQTTITKVVYGINNSGTTNINGGTINGTVNNSGTITMNDGTIKNLVTNNSGATLTITKGTVDNTTLQTNVSYAINNSGTLNISGDNSTTNIKAYMAYAINNTGTATITGGTVQLTKASTPTAIYNTGTLTLGTNDSTVSTTTPFIKATGMFGIKTTGTFNFYDGVIYGNTYSSVISGTVSSKKSGYTVATSYDSSTSLYKSYLLYSSNMKYSLANSSGVVLNYYTNLADAVSAANDGYTIKLLKTNTDYVNITKSIDLLTIDLNGYTLKNSSIPITINNSSARIGISSNGTIRSTTSSNDAISVTNGELTINSGTIYGITIGSGGTVILNTSSVKIYTDRTITNNGTLTINSASSSYSYSIINNSDVEIRGGTVSASVINNYTFTMSGGTISSTVTNEGTFTMSGGTISSTVTNEGTFTMSGGTISGAVTNERTFTMTSGTISSAVTNEGTFTMSGGTISVSSGTAVTNSGTFTISGGKIETTSTSSGAYGVKMEPVKIACSSSETCVTSVDGVAYKFQYLATLNISGTAVISSEGDYGVDTSTKLTVNFKSTSAYIYGSADNATAINYTPTITSGYTKVSVYDTSKELIKDYIVASTIYSNYAAIVVNDVTSSNPRIIGYYNSISSAISGIQTGYTGVKLLKDSTESVTISTAKTVTISLQTYTWSCSSGYALNINSASANVTITGSGNINKASNSYYAISNKGILTISNGSIQGIDNQKTLTISGGTVSAQSTGYSAIGNSSTVSMNGGVVYSITNYGDSASLTVTGGTIYSTDDKSAIENNSGTVTMSSATVYGITNSYYDDETSGGSITINSGYVRSTIYNSDYSTLNIKGGSIIASIYNDENSTVTITGGTVTNTSGVAINNNGTLILGTNDSSVSTTTPVIKSTTNYGIDNNGTFRFYDGVVYAYSSYSSVISGNVNTKPSGYSVVVVYDASTSLYKAYLFLDSSKNVSLTDTSNRIVGYYDKITDALTASSNGYTIKLLANISECVTNSRAISLSIDLNSKSWTCSTGAVLTVSNSSTSVTVTIKDTGGSGKMTSTASSSSAVGVKIDSSKVEILGGEIKGINPTSTAQLVVNGANVKITQGGTTYGIAASTSSTINITNCASITGGIIGFGQLNVSKGTIDYVYVWSDSSATITGGTISSLQNSGTTNISGGNLTSITNNSGAILNITGGTVQSTSSYAITNSGTLNLGTNDGSVSTTTPVIKSTSTYGINNSGTLNYYDGVVYGSSSAVISGSVSSLPSGYSVVKVFDTASSLYKAYLFLGSNLKVSLVDSSNRIVGYYSTISSAYSAAISGYTIKLLIDVNECVSITRSISITVSLDGHTWTCSTNSPLIINNSSANVTISGTGNIQYTGTSSDIGSIKNTSGTLNINGTSTSLIIYGIYNYATVNISNGKVQGTANAYAVYVDESATLNVTGGTIWGGSYSGTKGIINYGNVTVTAGTIQEVVNYKYTQLQGGTTSFISNYKNKVVLSSSAKVSYYISNYASLEVYSGVEVNASISNSASGSILISGGTFNLTSFYNSGSITMSSGTMTLSSQMSNSGTFGIGVAGISGTLTITNESGYVINNTGTINYYYGTLKSKGAKYTYISTGTFNIPNGGEYTYIDASGYYVTNVVSGAYTVGSSTYNTFAEAMSAGDEITLNKNITEQAITINTGIMLHLNGNILNNFVKDRAISSANYNFITINSGGILHINKYSNSDTGQIIIYNDSSATSDRYAIKVVSGAELGFYGGSLISEKQQKVIDVNIVDLVIPEDMHLVYSSGYTLSLASGAITITDASYNEVITGYASSATTDISGNLIFTISYSGSRLTGSAYLYKGDNTEITCTTSSTENTFVCTAPITTFFSEKTHLFNTEYIVPLTFVYKENSTVYLNINSPTYSLKIINNRNNGSVYYSVDTDDNKYEIITDGDIIIVRTNKIATGTSSIALPTDVVKKIYGDYYTNVVNSLSLSVSSTSNCTSNDLGICFSITYKVPTISLKSSSAPIFSSSLPVIYYDYTPKTVAGSATTTSITDCEYGSDCTVTALAFKDYKGNDVDEIENVITYEGKVVEQINTKMLGVYTVTTIARDIYGNSSSVVRQYNVVDVTPSIDTIPTEIVVNDISSNYVETDVKVIDDNIDTDIEVNVERKTNTSKKDNYVVTYREVDENGNEIIITKVITKKKTNKVVKNAVSFDSTSNDYTSMNLVHTKVRLNL